MARWVIPEYENRLAAVFVVVSLLTPWSVSRLVVQGGSMVLTYVRWPFVQWRRAAVQGGAGSRWMTPLGAYEFQTTSAGPTPLADAYAVWGVAALCFALTLCLAVALLVDEEWVAERTARFFERRPGPVVGALLLLDGVVFLVATVGIYLRGADGITLPLGALFMLLFGAVLLTNGEN